MWPHRQACDLTGFHQVPMEWRSTCTILNTSSSRVSQGADSLGREKSDLATRAASASTGEQLPHTEDGVFCPQVCASPFRRRAPVSALMALKIRVASRCVSSITHRVCEKTANLRIGATHGWTATHKNSLQTTQPKRASLWYQVKQHTKVGNNKPTVR